MNFNTPEASSINLGKQKPNLKKQRKNNEGSKALAKKTNLTNPILPEQISEQALKEASNKLKNNLNPTQQEELSKKLFDNLPPNLKEKIEGIVHKGPWTKSKKARIIPIPV